MQGPSLVLASPNEDLVSRKDIRRIYILGLAILLVLVAVGVTVALVFILDGNDSSSPTSPSDAVATSDTTTAPPTAEPAASPSLVFCGFTILKEQNLFGGDITLAIPLDMNYEEAVEECKDICAALPSCDSFTLVGAGAHALFNNPVPWCFVKDSVPSASPQDDMISGVKTSESESCSSPTASYTSLPATNLFGNDLFLPCIPLNLGSSQTLDTTSAVCQQICSAMSSCQAYSAVDPSIGPHFLVFSCCIKYGVPEYEPGGQPLVNSGIKL